MENQPTEKAMVIALQLLAERDHLMEAFLGLASASSETYADKQRDVLRLLHDCIATALANRLISKIG